MDIWSFNHSRELITAFVVSMLGVMNHRIQMYLHAIDAIAGGKRIFAFMEDKVTEHHITGDAVALMIMSEGGELQAVFFRLPFGYKTYGARSIDTDLPQNVREKIEARTRRYPRSVHGGDL